MKIKEWAKEWKEFWKESTEFSMECQMAFFEERGLWVIFLFAIFILIFLFISIV